MIERLQDLGAPEGEEADYAKFTEAAEELAKVEGEVEDGRRTRRRGGAGRSRPGSRRRAGRDSSRRRRSTASKTAAPKRRAPRPSTADRPPPAKNSKARRRRGRSRTRIRRTGPRRRNRPRRRTGPRNGRRRRRRRRSSGRSSRNRRRIRRRRTWLSVAVGEDGYPSAQRPSRQLVELRGLRRDFLSLRSRGVTRPLHDSCWFAETVSARVHWTAFRAVSIRRDCVNRRIATLFAVSPLCCELLNPGRPSEHCRRRVGSGVSGYSAWSRAQAL